MNRLLILISVLLTAPAFGTPALDYAGVLKNGGIAVDGNVDITFYIYADDADDVPIWTETHEDVVVSSGQFLVQLFSISEMSPSDLGIETLHM